MSIVLITTCEATYRHSRKRSSLKIIDIMTFYVSNLITENCGLYDPWLVRKERNHDRVVNESCSKHCFIVASSPLQIMETTWIAATKALSCTIVSLGPDTRISRAR